MQVIQKYISVLSNQMMIESVQNFKIRKKALFVKVYLHTTYCYTSSNTVITGRVINILTMSCWLPWLQVLHKKSSTLDGF